MEFAEKAKENSKSVLSRVASVDNTSDSTTGWRAQESFTTDRDARRELAAIVEAGGGLTLFR